MHSLHNRMPTPDRLCSRRPEPGSLEPVPNTRDQTTPINDQSTDSPAGHASLPSGAGTRGGTVADQDTEGSATVPQPARRGGVDEQTDEQQRARARRRLRGRIRRPAEPSDVDIIAERLAQEQSDI